MLIGSKEAGNVVDVDVVDVDLLLLPVVMAR